MRKIRIISDGMGYMTRVTDIETGQNITNIKKIDISIAPGDVVKAEITVACAELDIIADAEFTSEAKEEENVKEKEIESEAKIESQAD